MEYFLLIVVIILLILQNTKYSKDSNSLKREINILNEKLNGLYSLLNNQKSAKTVEEERPKEAPSTFLKKEEEAYIPTYANVIKLTDKDVGIIQQILNTAKDSNDYTTLMKLRDKMIAVLDLNEVKEKSDIEFINTILSDYNHYTNKKQLIDTPPITLENKAEMPVKLNKNVASAKSVMTAAPKKIVKQEPTLSIWEKFKQKNPDLEKFIGENLINKIGILILVLGISYFVKYAIDKDWINEPARVGIGVLAGSLILLIAHKLRQKYAPFSSVLVAGAIAIYYFTIYIAFHEYQLFGQEIAFAIMVVITAFSSLISLSYNRIELAILSLIGGFMVPFLVSTDSANYIALFTYIVILDIGILALAYFKKWQLLHILAFIFTMLLFIGWVIGDVQGDTPHYKGALIFAFSFYLIFIIINIINNLRSKGDLTKTQLVMLTVNNFVFYGIGVLVLSNFKPELTGLYTALLALINMGYSILLYKKFGLDKRGVYLLIGLSLTFITLAIPVQFSGNNITIFWALEAVLLIWLAQKSQIKNYRFAAVLVQCLMLGSLLIDWFVYVTPKSELAIILNPVFIAGILVIASFVAVNYLLRYETEKLIIFGFQFNPMYYKKLALILAIITGYFVGFFEVIYQSNQYFEFNGVLAILVQYHLMFTTIFCLLLYRNRTKSNDKIINIIAILNIVGFTLLFSRIPFAEITENISAGTKTQLAYVLHMASLIFIIALWYLVYNTNKKQKVFSVLNNKLAIWSAVIVLVVLASFEVVLQGIHLMNFSFDQVRLSDKYEMISTAKNKIIKTGLPVLWGILAFILLIWGIKKQIKQLRIIALALLGLTIVKLFVYDISNVSETGKIIAFILLGVLILIISFVYQKIKILVIDENKTAKDDKID